LVDVALRAIVRDARLRDHCSNESHDSMNGYHGSEPGHEQGG
jgi:hypothetical protein